METKDKYYTPTIEEFRVGFECELLTHDYKEEDTLEEQIKAKWLLFIYGDLDNHPYTTCSGYAIHNKCSQVYVLNKWLNKNVFRVKYLDKQDIEDLGFTETHYLKNTDYAITFEKQHKDGKAEITYWYSIHYIEIYTAEDVDTQFQGYCKNKSELQILLKQLNIQ